jgi:hypothetical protein
VFDEMVSWTGRISATMYAQGLDSRDFVIQILNHSKSSNLYYSGICDP